MLFAMPNFYESWLEAQKAGLFFIYSRDWGVVRMFSFANPHAIDFSDKYIIPFYVEMFFANGRIYKHALNIILRVKTVTSDDKK